MAIVVGPSEAETEQAIRVAHHASIDIADPITTCACGRYLYDCEERFLLERLDESRERLGFTQRLAIRAIAGFHLAQHTGDDWRACPRPLCAQGQDLLP